MFIVFVEEPYFHQLCMYVLYVSIYVCMYECTVSCAGGLSGHRAALRARCGQRKDRVCHAGGLAAAGICMYACMYVCMCVSWWPPWQRRVGQRSPIEPLFVLPSQPPLVACMTWPHCMCGYLCLSVCVSVRAAGPARTRSTMRRCGRLWTCSRALQATRGSRRCSLWHCMCVCMYMCSCPDPDDGRLI